MKALCVLIVIVSLALGAFTSPGLPQNRDDAEKLYDEALAADRTFRTRDQVEPKLIQALEIFERLGDRQRVADVSLSLAKKYERYPGKAIPMYEKTLALYKELNHGKGEAETLKALAIFFFFRMKDYSKGEEYSEKALFCYRNVKDRPGEAWALSSLAGYHRRAGRYDRAVANYQESIDINRELAEKDNEGLALLALSSTYRDWGQYEKAVESFEKLIALCRELKNIHCEADALQGIGRTYEQWGNREKAAEYASRFHKVVNEIMTSGGKPKSR